MSAAQPVPPSSRPLAPAVLELQAFGGLCLAAAALGVLAVVQAERRGLAAAAVFLVGGAIYLGVVWRLQGRSAVERALGGAAPAPEDARLEPRALTALRAGAGAAAVAAVAVLLGRLHLGGAGIVVLLGAGAVALLRATAITRSERERAARVLRVRGSGAYVLRPRTVDSSLRVVAPPEAR